MAARVALASRSITVGESAASAEIASAKRISQIGMSPSFRRAPPARGLCWHVRDILPLRAARRDIPATGLDAGCGQGFRASRDTKKPGCTLKGRECTSEEFRVAFCAQITILMCCRNPTHDDRPARRRWYTYTWFNCTTQNKAGQPHARLTCWYSLVPHKR